VYLLLFSSLFSHCIHFCFTLFRSLP